MGNAYQEPTIDIGGTNPTGDPRRVADVVLAAAVRAHADAIYLEPTMSLGELVDDAYLVTFERASQPVGTLTLPVGLGAAVIARLAFLAQLDLAGTSASSGVLPVKSGSREADVVITVRPGASLRADVMVMQRKAAKAMLTPGVLSSGDVIGNYKILERLGEGGMGTVFSVEHVALGRKYALKVLRSKVVAREPTAAQRFLREARASARIHHPNIVDVFDFGHVPDGRPYFVMELLEGESLSDRVDRGALPIGEVVTIARQLALGLAAAHDCGVVHADVTPSNALVLTPPAGSDQLVVKILDFGLAELAGETALAEESDFVLGTPAYISPEQLRGLAPTERSDQYGLGAVLFQLTTGHPPFEDADLRALCMKHIQAPIPPVTSPHGPLPGKLADVITTCLQKAPGARFPGMRALIAALDEIEKMVDRRGWRKWLSS